MALTRPTIQNLNTNNAAFNDSLTVTNFANVANRDIGQIFDRSQASKPNVAIIWSETYQSFLLAYTNDSGQINGNITVLSNADLILSNVTATGTGTFRDNVTIGSGYNTSSTSTGALVVTGGVGVSGNIFAGNVLASDYFYANGEIVSRAVIITGDATGTGITGSNTNITLVNTGVVSGTYGNSVAIPVVEVDSKGRILSMNTAAVYTDFTLLADSGTGNVSGGGTITLNGYANEIETSVAGSTYTFRLPTNLVTPGSLTITGNLTVNGNTTFINANTITTNDKSITLANNQTATTALDGGGIDLGQNGVVTWTYNYATNSWRSNVGITPEGNASLAFGNSTNYWGLGYFNAIEAPTITGVLYTPGQPNITSVGTLTGLSLSGTLNGTTLQASQIGNTGATLTGTLNTSNQPFITNVGKLLDLNVAGPITGSIVNAATFGNAGAVFTGETYTASSSFNGPHNGTLGSAGGNTAIVSTLSATANATVNALTVNGSATVGSTLGVTGNVTAGNLTTGTVDADVMVVDSITILGGIQNTPIGNAIASTGAFTTLSATGTFTGTTVNAAQIGNVGANLTGTLQTADQPNVTHLGTLTNLTIAGTTTGSTIEAAQIGNTGTTLTGTLSTSSQPNITTVGTLGNLTVAGQIDAATIQGATIGNTGAAFTGATYTATTSFNGPHNGTLGSAGGNTAIVSTLSATSTATVNELISNTSIATATSVTSGSLVTGTVNANANATVNALTVNNSATVGGTLGVTSNINGSSATLTGSATIGTTLGVVGNINGSSASLTGSATIGTTLGVTGEITSAGNVFAKRFNSTDTSLSAPVQGSDAGYRLTVYDFNADAVNYGIGAEGGHVWFAVDSYADTDGFKFYGNVNEVAKITGIGNFYLDGNITASSAGFGNTISATGNITGGGLTSNGSITATTTISAAAGIQNTPIGNVTPSTGNFTSISITGNIGVDGLTVANSATIGTTLDVTGNTQVGNLRTAGTILITNTTNSVGANTGALIVQGGASFEKDIHVLGSIYATNVIAINANTLSVQDPLLYLTANTPYPYNYDIGFHSQFVGGVGNIYQHTGFVRDVDDSVWKLFSNVVPEPTITVDFTNATYDEILTGTHTVIGDINASGQLNVYGTATVGNLVANGSISGGTINLSNASISGNLTTNGLTVNTSAVVGTTLQAVAGIQNTVIGNVTPTTAQFTTLSTSGNITAAAITANGSITTGTTVHATGGVQNTPIGNGTASTGAFTTLTSSGLTTVTNSTESTGSTTGALVVDGGVGVAKRLNVAGLATFGNVTVSDKTISSNVTNTGVTIDPNGTGQTTINSGLNNSKTVINGTAANTFVVSGTQVGVNVSAFTTGATFEVNAADSMMLPKGDTTQRPTGVAGMFRYNSLLQTTEFYTGTEWKSGAQQFTMVVANVQQGDNVTTVFTIPTANASTAGTIISINGVVQEPITAYSIAGNVVTFTEAPSDTDTIDFRTFTTTSTVTGIVDTVGTTGVFVEVVPGDKTVTFKNQNNTTVTIDPNGYLNLEANGVISSTPSVTVGTGGGTLDVWSGTAYKAAKYIVTARDSGGTTWTSLEALVVTNGAANAAITTWGTVTAGASGTPQVSMSASATGGVVTVTATGAGAGTVVNFTKTYVVGS